MVAVLIPHFDLPFRLAGTSFAVVEQDTHEDIGNCVEAIVRTPNGFRDDSPDFGLDDSLFSLIPLNLELLTAQVKSQEPRAQVFMTQDFENLVDKITVVVE